MIFKKKKIKRTFLENILFKKIEFNNYLIVQNESLILNKDEILKDIKMLKNGHPILETNKKINFVEYINGDLSLRYNIEFPIDIFKPINKSFPKIELYINENNNEINIIKIKEDYVKEILKDFLPMTYKNTTWEEINSCLDGFDCNGECGGNAVEDCFGVCGGDKVEDCAGICGGDRSERLCWDMWR